MSDFQLVVELEDDAAELAHHPDTPLHPDKGL